MMAIRQVAEDQALEVLGRKIAELRVKYGMRQAELARQVGVSRSQMCKHEQGTAEMPLSRLLRICRLIGSSPASLLRAVDGHSNHSI